MTLPLPHAEIEIPEDLQKAILEFNVHRPEGPPMSVGALLELARKSIEAANSSLRESPLVQRVSHQLMLQEKRRGRPMIQATLEGRCYLHVSYLPIEELAPRKSRINLPDIASLRTRANQLGLDISNLGRNKHQIMARIKEAEARQGQDSLILDGIR